MTSSTVDKDDLQDVFITAQKQGIAQGAALGFEAGFAHGIKDGRTMGFELGFLAGAAKAARDSGVAVHAANNLLDLLKGVIPAGTVNVMSSTSHANEFVAPDENRLDRIRAAARLLETKLKIKFDQTGETQQSEPGLEW